MIFTTLLSLTTLFMANAWPIPRSHTTVTSSGPSCSSLEIWQEYENLGVHVMLPENDFPSYENLTAKDDKIDIEFRAQSVDMAKLRDYTTQVVQAYPLYTVEITVFALNVTLQSQSLENVPLRCKKCENPRCDPVVHYDRNSSFPRRFTWPEGARVNIFASTFIAPWDEWEQRQGELAAQYELNNGCSLVNDTDGTEFKVWIPNGFLRFDAAEVDGSYKFTMANSSTGYIRMKSLDYSNLALKGSLDSLLYWSMYACARRFASWNYRSATLENAKFAYYLAEGVSVRLSALGNDTRTSSLDSLLVLSKSLQQSLINQYEILPVVNKTFVPANILVPKWSVDKLQSKITTLGTVGTNFAQKLSNGLDSTSTDETRLQNLKDMATLQGNSANANEFNLEQGLQQLVSYNKSVVSLTNQTNELGNDVSTANDRFQEGVKVWKSWSIAKSVWTFFGSIAKVAMGIVEGNLLDVFDGVSDFFEGAEELYMLKRDLQELNELNKELEEYDDLLKELPLNSTEMTKFIEAVGKGNYTESLFGEDVKNALLKLSEFDRASADKIALKYDTAAASIGPLMKSSEDNEIDGATSLEVAYKKLCVSGKAMITAKIALAQAKSDFAKQLYQVISDTRSSGYIQSEVEKVEGKILAEKSKFLQWGISSAVSVQNMLLDSLVSICSAFYYSEAEECNIVSDDTLKAFSLQGMDEFVGAVLKGAAALEDVAPLSRQAWTIVDQPLTISYDDVVGKKLIDSFRQTGTTTIPSKVFESIPRLKYLSAVCMVSASVEVVGAKGSVDGNKEVEVFVGTMSSPAMQKNGNAEALKFKTPSMNIKSSYTIGMRDKMVDMPYWGVEGKLYDTSSRFCRTPFQDFVLKVGKTSEGLNWSNATEIKLYLYGNANTAQGNVDLGPIELNGAKQELWDGVSERKIVSSEWRPSEW